MPISNAAQISINPHVGAFANEVYVTWEAKNPLNSDVFLKKALMVVLRLEAPLT